MKRAALALIAASTVLGTPALAADMAVKAPPQPVAAPAPVYSWTGFYIGGNGGYGWKDPTVAFTPNDHNANSASCGGVYGSTCPAPASFGIGGALGGLQAGYNWQVNQAWLIGVEADFDWSHIDGQGTSNFLIAPGVFPPGTSNFVVNQNVEWFGTVRGRLGWTPMNQTLLYGTAGLAYGHVSENVALNSTTGNNLSGPTFGFFCTTGANCFVGNSSRTATGWTVGGGVEYAVWQNLSVKAELLYVDLGGGDTVRVTAVNGGSLGCAGLACTPSSFSAAFSRLDFYVARGGLNWKF